jgi:acyl dehydratase
MTRVDARRASRRISARDFLMGSIWEGTGDELHTNRVAARASIFGARTLPGITGMVLGLAEFDVEIVWGTAAGLEWQFDAPVFEDVELEVDGRRTRDGWRVTGAVEGRPATHGTVLLDAADWEEPAYAVRRTIGRTVTAADVELFAGWVGGSPPAGRIPWPLVVLVASGLINRTDYLGHPGVVLNRWFRWRFRRPVPVERTLSCGIAPVRSRPSRSRPDLRVAEFRACVDDGCDEPVATVEWVVLFA